MRALRGMCARCGDPSGQCFDRRDRYQPRHSLRELRVERDERVGLELGQGEVLGLERVGPPELVGDLPRDALKDAVSEQSNRSPRT